MPVGFVGLCVLLVGKFVGQVLPALAGREVVEFFRRFQHDQFVILQTKVAVAEIRADITGPAQLGQDLGDQHLVFIQTLLADRRGEIDIDVDDAVAFVEDADCFYVMATAGSVGDAEWPAELDIGFAVHSRRIHQMPLNLIPGLSSEQLHRA
ncbi:hypothetical protein CFU_1639 [Collimonas fungivorans Ter331]|uniref:Uncharacterized protein n=1 Tax=Collimonas fungivorans (strain Ter331) TaxID=1005048 RepID=G0A8J8_COLFT|nr:hypothetical protein CFU_1639 [Collimonas fungivorans Ter331]